MTPLAIASVTDTVQLVRAGQTYVDAIYFYNASNALAFIQFFDTDVPGSVTLGTTKPVFSVGTATATSFHLPGMHLLFSKGLCIAAATTFGGSSAPSAGLNCSLALG